MNKNNVPYYIAGTLAALTLLASGVFAAAPYIGFLAPVAALSVGLPFIIGGAVFSAVAIALSYAAVSKNKTISEKEAQLSDEKSKVEAKGKIISEKVKEISEKNTQLANQAKEIEDKDKTISEKDREIFRMKNELAATRRINASQPGNAVEFDSINQQLTKRDFEVQTQEQAIISQAKGKFNSVGNKLKNIYDTMPSTKIEFSWVSEKFSPYWNSVKNLMFGNKADQASGASQLSSESQGNGIVIPEGAKLELSPILFDFLFREKQKMVRQFLREQTDEKKNVATQENLKTETPSQENQMNIDNVPKQPDHLNVDAAKRYLMSLSEDQDVFYDAESGDEKGTEISSPESQPTKEENGQGWFAWSLGKVKSAMTEVVVIDADVTKSHFAKVTKALAT
ncbi:hypothetical protein [Wolbachia endosymbiont (group A) of Cydia splendana]|uniref:hypothetical protein n=1 Tax=Wolbachia endosymbiont (group A) of Cydia splendana TaxID=2954000 RepID=UPI0021F91713|nr:hypothetical protein [Wolbachia endosymbiont (group A) of Cydia splendana]